MSATTTQATLSGSTDDTYSSVLATRNTLYANSLLAVGADGKFGIGVDAFHRFSGINVPAGVHISRATLTMYVGTPFGGFTPQHGPVIRDGVWNVATGTGFRLVDGHDVGLKGRTGGAATLFDTGVATVPTTFWEIREATVPARFERIAQSATATAPGTLADVQIWLGKLGNPIGNVWVEIWSDDGGDKPLALLATSATIAAAAVTAGLTLHTFGGLALAITNGVKYVVVVRTDHARSAANHVRVGKVELWPSGPYAGGVMSVQGSGTGFDDQNYPTGAAFYGVPFNAAGSVDFPSPSAGGLYTSPDFSRLLQRHIELPGYVNDGLLGWRIGIGDATIGQQYTYVSWDHPFLAAPVIDITWRAKRKIIT